MGVELAADGNCLKSAPRNTAGARSGRCSGTHYLHEQPLLAGIDPSLKSQESQRQIGEQAVDSRRGNYAASPRPSHITIVMLNRRHIESLRWSQAEHDVYWHITTID